MRISASPENRQAGRSSPAPQASPAAKLKQRIDTLRARYWWFMNQEPPQLKAASLCQIELRRLMQKQLEREIREDRRRIVDMDDCVEVYGQ